MSEDARTYELYTRASPEQVWQALTDPELTQEYYFGTRVESDWEPGSQVRYRNAEGGVDVEGEILEVSSPARLVTTFVPSFVPAAVPESTVRWEVEPAGSASKLRLTHSGFDFSSPAAAPIHEGWVWTVSSLKTLLETGESLGQPPGPPPA